VKWRLARQGVTVALFGHVISERLRQRARAAQLPPSAPMAMAEQVAIDAFIGGAGVEAAVDNGWAFLSSWSRHPAGTARLRPTEGRFDERRRDWSDWWHSEGWSEGRPG
jgi:hypothetical protein